MSKNLLRFSNEVVLRYLGCSSYCFQPDFYKGIIIEVGCHLVREKVISGYIVTNYSYSNIQLADNLT